MIRTIYLEVEDAVLLRKPVIESNEQEAESDCSPWTLIYNEVGKVVREAAKMPWSTR